MTELTEDNLQEIISTNEKVIVQFGATWCGACRVMKPRVKKLAESTDGVIFIYADAEKFTESRGVTVVRNLPTFAGFVNGELVAKSTGSKIDALVELVNEVVKA